MEDKFKEILHSYRWEPSHSLEKLRGMIKVPKLQAEGAERKARPKGWGDGSCVFMRTWVRCLTLSLKKSLSRLLLHGRAVKSRSWELTASQEFQSQWETLGYKGVTRCPPSELLGTHISTTQTHTKLKAQNLFEEMIGERVSHICGNNEEAFRTSTIWHSQDVKLLSKAGEMAHS